ncbi:Cytochrome c oxidase subunit 2 / GIY-YIG domain of intron endonuclease I (mitochondrion) [Ustilago bromivora]|uniref:Cytochrome c oxidase subunit 2 n=1 Tax=Ustilago bromivora TaxID=307758 RepID=A0A1K0GEN2_9BASI|nr:Cytochrome c oxidase subunit 2 / GIY-YIG domain of intron endonuclease I [Ustilago bromivora]
MFNLFRVATTAIFNDAPQPWQLGFQDGASPTQEGITELHDSIFFYLVFICFGVLWVLSSVIINFNSNKSQLVYKYANHGTLIELIWTITPALVLIAIAFPSFKLLYLMDEVISPSMTVKVAGHQWYWSAEYSDFINEDGESIEFDSYMVPETDLEDGQLRLLEVDNRMVVPIDTHIRFIVTGADVIHDFAVPSLGLKIDAVPGRLNQTSVLIEREGVFYGQCSEICGVYHGFMPVAIEAVTPEKYLAWIDSQASPLFILASEVDTNNVVDGASTKYNGNGEYIAYGGMILKVWNPLVKYYEQCTNIFCFFPIDHPLNKFITENLMHTLVDPTGHTSILYSDLSTEALDMNASTFSLNNNFTPSQFQKNSGVYIVYNSDGSESYVGSATDFCKRWANHYNSMYKDNQCGT